MNMDRDKMEVVGFSIPELRYARELKTRRGGGDL